MAHSPLTVGSGDHHVLALHGWFGSARGWGSLPDYLDGSAFTYVFMDLRGYGDRQQAGGEFTMASHQVLLQAPDRVRKLVGINPVPATSVPMDEQGWALFSGAAAQAGNRAAIIDFTTGNKLTKTFIDQVVRHSLDHSSVGAFGAYLRSWATDDFSSSLKPDHGTPVKVIAGETDPALSAAVMEQTWLAFFPGAELTVLANAGHYPMFETPVALATCIEEFLGRE